MKRAVDYITIIILALLLTLTTTTAAVPDFQATTFPQLNAQTCQTLNNTLTITNTDATTATYTLWNTGNTKNWAQQQNTRTLPAQTITTHAQTLTIPCNIPTGIYIIETHIRTGTLEKALTQTITITKPTNIDLIPETQKQYIYTQKTATYHLTIPNTANFTETYTFSITTPKPITTTHNKTLTLLPHTNGTLTITTLPTTIPGTYTFNITGTTTNTKLKATLPLTLVVLDHGIAAIQHNTTLTITNLTTPYLLPFTIHNQGSTTTTYNLTLTGIPEARLTTNTLTITPFGNATNNILIIPTNTTRQGKYTLYLNITATNTHNTYTSTLAITIKPKSYAQPNLKIAAEVLLALLIISAIILTTYGIIRITKRKKDKNKQAPKKTKPLTEKQLRKSIEQDIKQHYQLIDKKHFRTSQKQHFPWKRTLLTIATLIIAFLLAYYTFLNTYAAYTTITIAVVTLLTLLAIKIRATRRAHKHWDLIFTSKKYSLITHWRTGVGELRLTTNKNIENAHLALRKKKTIFTPTGYPTYSHFTLDARTLTEEDIDTLTIRFKIPKKWYHNYRLDKNTTQLTYYDGNRWRELPTRKITEDKHYTYYTTTTSFLGQYAITAKKQPSTRIHLSRKRELIILSAIILLLIGAASLYWTNIQTTPYIQTYNETKGIPTQIWAENTPYRINLDKYFKDPDGDQLTYTFIPKPDHITINITNNTALLTPDTDWTGRTNTSIIATDGKGGTIHSNNFTLTITPATNILPKPARQWYRTYKIYIWTGAILGILILALLILFFEYGKTVMKFLEE